MSDATRKYLPPQAQGHQAEPTAAPEKKGTGGGWFRACRYSQMPDLVTESRTAFVLAYMLAFRCRRNADAYNPFKLELGEAVCDYDNWGLSEQEFRTARDKLKKSRFATFRVTAIGRKHVTVGKLMDTRLFSVLDDVGKELCNGPCNDTATDHATDHATTYRERRAENLRTENKIGGSDAPQATRHSVSVFSKPSMKELKQYARSKGIDEPEGIKAFVKCNERSGWRLRNWRAAFDAYLVEGGYADP